MEIVVVAASTLGFLLGWILYGSIKPKKVDSIDEELDDIINSDHNKVKGRFE